MIENELQVVAELVHALNNLDSEIVTFDVNVIDTNGECVATLVYQASVGGYVTKGKP